MWARVYNSTGRKYWVWHFMYVWSMEPHHTWPNRPRTNDLQNRVLLWSFQSCRTMLAVFVQNAHGLTWIQCGTIWGILCLLHNNTHHQLFLHCVHATLRCSLSEGLVSRGPVCLLRGFQGRDGNDLRSLRTLWESGYKCIQVPTIPSGFAYKLLATLKSIVHFSAEQIF